MVITSRLLLPLVLFAIVESATFEEQLDDVDKVCGANAAVRYLQDEGNYEQIKLPGGYEPGDTIEASCRSGGEVDELKCECNQWTNLKKKDAKIGCPGRR